MTTISANTNNFGGSRPWQNKAEKHLEREGGYLLRLGGRAGPVASDTRYRREKGREPKMQRTTPPYSLQRTTTKKNSGTDTRPLLRRRPRQQAQGRGRPRAAQALQPSSAPADARPQKRPEPEPVSYSRGAVRARGHYRPGRVVRRRAEQARTAPPGERGRQRVPPGLRRGQAQTQPSSRRPKPLQYRHPPRNPRPQPPLARR